MCAMLGCALLAVATAPPALARTARGPASSERPGLPLAHAAQLIRAVPIDAGTTTSASGPTLSSSVATTAAPSTTSAPTTTAAPPPVVATTTASSTVTVPPAPGPTPSAAGPSAAVGPAPAASPGPSADTPTGATGPAASVPSSVTGPDDGTLFATGPTLAGGASAPASARRSGGTQAPARARRPTTRSAAAAAAAAASAAGVALPPLPFNGVLALTDPFASMADSVLGYFRIPLFLLPIYQAAGDEYGVPWQVLAAINEIETDYGHDLGVSSAGALGWMQFMPTTWMLYGVDATASGVADPYNPADAIFAAARLLRDAGARKHLADAIFAYNHSSAYVDSVLLRAQLIEDYPASLIDALTALSIGDTPVHNGDVRSVDYGPAPRKPVAVARAARRSRGVAQEDSPAPAAAADAVTTPGLADPRGPRRTHRQRGHLAGVRR